MADSARRRTSVAIARPTPVDDEESLVTFAGGRSTRAGSSTAVHTLSSSFGLPSRSHIHAGHRYQEPTRYSSLGVRDQTAVLSSSLLIESEPSRGFDRRRLSVSSQDDSQPRPIDEETTLGATNITDDDQPPHPPGVLLEDDERVFEATEQTPLLPRKRLPSHRKALPIESPNGTNVQHLPSREEHLEPPEPKDPSLLTKCQHHLVQLNPKSWNTRHVTRKLFVEPLSLLPAVFLGLMLNLLDALSYGIILFPLGEAPFADMGADGVCMFYVSSIVAQLTYSSGSIFKGGVGSEMIEVVPFFHKMAYIIMAHMGGASADADAVRATVIVSYATSSILTGLIFFGLGAARLGTLVNFFPRSILIGCVGGVGIFLVVTGLEVSARLDGNLDFTLDVARKLVAMDVLVLWVPPLVLAVLLLSIKHFYDRPWLVPAYYIGITAIFYTVTAATPTISMDDLRAAGWVFEPPAANVPFYNFYRHYQFNVVDWGAVWATAPSQLALSFFAVLHVPVNVPNLALLMQEDDVSIDRELILHGLSNTLSGMVGSIQNYLVLVNSVLVMESGGNTRVAGYLLAAATGGLWVAGPVVIGYVPVMVVGTLIYFLGVDLAREALVATYGRLHHLEYLIIVLISLIMGFVDFLLGIGVGIAMACLVNTVQFSQQPVIRAEFSGMNKSTIRRHARHRDYLRKVSSQIRIFKLSGFLFFGSIVNVEKKVKGLIDAEAFANCPIRFVVVDLSHVTGIDFSAAEAFGRMNRILHRRQVKMAMAGVTLGSEVGRSLSMVGLFVDQDDDAGVPAPTVYEDLNGALEACENELLVVLSERQLWNAPASNLSPPSMHGTGLSAIAVPESATTASPSAADTINMFGSPRHQLLQQAATTTLSESGPQEAPWHDQPAPLPLIQTAFLGMTSRPADFWRQAVPYFERREFAAGTQVYAKGDRPDGLYLLQSGVLKASYYLEQGAYHESIVAGTTCGEMPFFGDTRRTSGVVAERDTVAWVLTADKWRQLQQRAPEVAMELFKVGFRLSAERTAAMTNFVLITAS